MDLGVGFRSAQYARAGDFKHDWEPELQGPGLVVLSAQSLWLKNEGTDEARRLTSPQDNPALPVTLITASVGSPFSDRDDFMPKGTESGCVSAILLRQFGIGDGSGVVRNDDDGAATGLRCPRANPSLLRRSRGRASTLLRVFRLALARKFHTQIEQKSGGSVTRLVNIEPNASTTHRIFFDRV